MFSDAKQYHAYARECLRLAEEADGPEIRQRLIELSRTWMEAALTAEREALKRRQSMGHGGSEKT
jgi:hypothetical protein